MYAVYCCVCVRMSMVVCRMGWKWLYIHKSLLPLDTVERKTIPFSQCQLAIIPGLFIFVHFVCGRILQIQKLGWTPAPTRLLLITQSCYNCFYGSRRGVIFESLCQCICVCIQIWSRSYLVSYPTFCKLPNLL